jgi:hypothetical protein
MRGAAKPDGIALAPLQALHTLPAASFICVIRNRVPGCGRFPHLCQRAAGWLPRP